KKESVSKQGRKKAKPRPTLDDSTFDDLDADLAHGMDYMEIEEAVNGGRQSKETGELNVTHDTEVLEKEGSNKEPVNAAGNIGVSTAGPEIKLKGVSIKEVKESARPARSVLTLKPLLKIDPKDKGNGILKEELEPTKKLKKSDLDAAQLAMDEEVAR
ncbi:hypothetical protein Tco_0061432, partial [Tanacetum coccineum]